MKYLINKQNGMYDKIIHWTGDVYQIDYALGDNEDIEYHLNTDDTGKTLIISPTSDSLFDFKNKKYPIGSYIVYTDNLKKGTLPIFRASKKYIDAHYVKPAKIKSVDITNNKSGKHYTAYYYDGSFATLPKGYSDFRRLRINDKKQLVEDVSLIGIHTYSGLRKAQPNWKIQANPGDYLIVRDDGFGLDNDSPIKVINRDNLKKRFSKSKVVKLPKEIFVVTSDVGEYSDREVKDLKVFTSYRHAQQYADQNEDWYVHPIETRK